MITGIVVQARNSSSRYPRKMMHDFGEKTALEWVLDRCKKVNVNYKILATSREKDDDVLADYALIKGWSVVRGSLDDVLNRFAQAVREYNLDIVVRITGDCVLTDYRLVNFALEKFIELKADYLELTLIIDGFDVEIISGRAILVADKNAKLPSEREHVGPFIRNSGKFNVINLPYGNSDMSQIHLSLDYCEDADSIGRILERFGEREFSYEDVVNLIKDDQSILEKTKQIVPNEGYRKSLEEDRVFLMDLKRRHLIFGDDKRIYLKILSVADVSHDYVAWMNDEETTQFLESRGKNRTTGDIVDYVQLMIESPDDFLFGIFLKESGEHIGNIKIGNINQRHKFADIGLIIGNKGQRGKGYGTEAVALATKYAFEVLRLNKLTAGIYANNMASYKAFINAGYREAGRLRKHNLFKGQYVDDILVENINEEG